MSLKHSSKPKILVVDDEPDNLDLLYRTFRREYTVVRSDSGLEALDILEQESDIAIIISDQRMPQMSGTELLKIAAVQYPNTMRIMLTGYTDVEDLVEAINEGKVYKYVTKPWDADKLKGIVEQALETHNLLRIRTQELSRSLRRESLLNSVVNTIRNRRYDDPNASPLQDVLQSIVNTVGEVMEVDVSLLKPLDLEMSARSPYFLYQRSPEQTENINLPWDLTLWETREPVIIDDVVTDESGLVRGNSDRQGAFEQAKIRSTLIVPLLLQHEPSAVLALHHCASQHTWVEDEVQLVKIVAAQAALAIAQARAYEKVKDLAQRETLINTITSAIRSSLEPEVIFRAITKQLGQALAVDGCALSLWSKQDHVVHCVGLYDADAPEDAAIEMPQSTVPIADNPVLQKVLATLQPVVYDDMNEEHNLEKYDLPLRVPARALLLVPMITEGELIGTISLRQTGESRQWFPAEITLAQAVAAQAAIAVQQSRLYETTRQQAELLREREQKVKQLNKYLTESVLKRFLPQVMVNQAAAGELTLDLSPEPRFVTILFSDIVGFTPLSTTLGPRLVAELLNEYLEAMTKAVFDNRGTVDKFIGDAVLALFGAPEELPPREQAQRAIAVARAMGKSLQELNQQWQARGIIGCEGKPALLKFRCGIHQGNAVVGMFGGGQRSDYTAIGPAVNMAARLQEAATPMHVLISEAVAEHLEGDSTLTSHNDLHLKGIDEIIRAFSFPL